ncbi:VOC family protein [Pseudaestuariivita rosea]|uniref:VOC family protein n=1 Tax=Pseudaestuariivita rosea TaxID=2763263 RepID=UPI001ABB1627|nr:VOC family protein [Pseudaestuariivita rosea]
MSQPTIVPYFSFADGAAAIEFLEKAFGFEIIQRQDAEDGTLIHCEMRYGDGVVMMGTDAGRAKGSPGVYVVVEDVQAHHDRAMKHGARIVYGPEQTEWGTWRYRALGPEGHEFTFGTYSPSTEPPSWA